MRLLKYSAAVLASFFVLATAAQAAGDAQNGKAVFQRCTICHTAEKGGGNGLGPNLFGVVRRKAASLPDFAYSPALKASGIVWTPDKLTTWVEGPAKMVPGTKMMFPGITQTSQAVDVVAYLTTLK